MATDWIMVEAAEAVKRPRKSWLTTTASVAPMGFLLGALLAANPLAQRSDSATLFGRWRSVETSRGGLGSMMTFRQGGLVDYSPGAIVEAPYRVEGNQLILPSATTNGPEQRQTMTWLGKHRLRLSESEGQSGLELAREGSAGDSVDPIVGEWSGMRDMGGKKVEVTYLFYPNGRSLFLIRFLTQRGSYSSSVAKIHLVLPGGPPVDATFTVDGQVLTLTTDGRSTRYRRY